MSGFRKLWSESRIESETGFLTGFCGRFSGAAQNLANCLRVVMTLLLNTHRSHEVFKLHFARFLVRFEHAIVGGGGASCAHGSVRDIRV
jgi:hypothetical protein